MVDASVEGKLYNLVACQRHNESLWNIAQNVSVPVENLEQDREIRRLEGLSVDVERVTGRGGLQKASCVCVSVRPGERGLKDSRMRT